MRRWMLALLGIALAVVPALVVYYWLQPYRAYFDHGQGIARCERVAITDIASPDGQVVELDADESQDFLFAWARTPQSQLFSALCHAPAFKIEFLGGPGSLTIDALCLECSNFPMVIRGQTIYQGIDLRCETGRHLVAVLKTHFAYLFDEADEPSHDDLRN